MDIDWNHDESGVKPQLTNHFEIVAEHLKDKLSESITVNRPVIKGTLHEMEWYAWGFYSILSNNWIKN